MAKLTVENILGLLPIVADRGWQLDVTGRVRDKNGACPLCALVNEIKGEERWTITYGLAMLDLGIYAYDESRMAANAIALAADNKKQEHRQELLQALGLSE